MNQLNEQDLLSVWEYGLDHSFVGTNLYLLSLAYPQYGFDQIATLPIGERDHRLIEIRKKLFGPVLSNVSNCAACGQKVEWQTTIEEIQLHKENREDRNKPFELLYQEHLIRFRLPNSHDLIDLTDQGAIKSNPSELIKKCIVESTLPFEQLKHIPHELETQLASKMEEYDPQANIVMSLSCPGCRNSWEAIFDITHYLWTEINDWAIQLLQDVQLLATHFGWSEKDIIEMSPYRRNFYINLIMG